jgi:hypothetical protein
VLCGRARFAGTVSTKAIAIGGTDKPSSSRNSRSSAALVVVSIPLPFTRNSSLYS